jgi:hypothetical protein
MDISAEFGCETRKLRTLLPAAARQSASWLASTAQTMQLKIVVTRYDEGNAFARFMLAGPGQIRIEGDVLLLDSETTQEIAAYKVSKDFSFGSLYGGSTNVHDVEKGFARSVAEVVKRRT